MKRIEMKDMPVVLKRGNLKVEQESLASLENTGVGIVTYGVTVGDTIEFPDSEADLHVMSRQVRPNNDAKEMLVSVLKNGKPAWFSVANLRRWDNEMKAVHPVAADLRNCETDAERIKLCFGRKITATEEVTFKTAVFENGVRTDATQERTVAKLEWVA